MDFPKRMLLNNGAWVKEKLELRSNFFHKMVAGQKPNALWIGCSDSRVPAEELTGARAGELFVHRNVANLFTQEDKSAMSVLTYAVETLQVPYVILCGHTGCGGVTAAALGKNDGVLGEWLKPISELRHTLVSPNMTEAEKVSAFVRANVEEGIRRLGETQVIQEAWAKNKAPLLLGWLYDTFGGRLKEQVRVDPAGETTISDTDSFSKLSVEVS